MTDILTQSALRITRIPVPETLDSPDAALFLEMVRIANAVCLAESGHNDLYEEPGEMLGFWQDQTDWTQLGFVAQRGDDVVGAVKLMTGAQGDSTTIEFDLMVEPEHRGGGIEEALLAEVEREARERGRSIIQTWTLHRPDAGGEQLAPPTGFGSVPADDSQTRFLVRSGFTLGQVERNSAFDLQGDFSIVEEMLAGALAVAGDEYELVTWTAPTPPEYRDGFAYAISRMSTDAPTGDTVVDEQHWDAERVERRDARLARQGLTVSVAVVVHRSTGQVAAYNELVIGEDPEATTHQYGTLVLKEHRGRRLGTIVKCANLLRWRTVAPRSPKVSTFNAEENRHMLGINETIGFVPVTYAGAWKKTLDG
ncbi:GNAT superfamily N-acetyltransferase [Microbacterium terrae]|uniref:Mycothiol acetyltransferase n=1 Tax=Microbacterium terrae TaxID=69369 RepID=A0A0M2GY32_9MICO|nr:GNAT family N-acetyltransferase [Microbacterium terrae]KJL38931.1 Mycothiol acetyltransferase [Microbacterium terrae]MBP1077129.1 GNAT superfamily N-acetyltransferase [Microbacterium terrae]GLJ99723.1 hypothetical protein GCM10017594_29210 [Microbacterium terrae]